MGDESDNSESGSERKKKKTKKDKKVKSAVKTTEDKSTNGVSLPDDKICDEDHVVLHNQETFEDCISNLENVLVKADKLTNNEHEQGTDKADNDNKDDKDLREILKAKSSLNSASNMNVKPVQKRRKIWTTFHQTNMKITKKKTVLTYMSIVNMMRWLDHQIKKGKNLKGLKDIQILGQMTKVQR